MFLLFSKVRLINAVVYYCYYYYCSFVYFSMLEHPHQKLLQGLHSFPFEFRLPLINLPSDYEGVNGHVRYRLRCDIVGDSPLSNAKVGRKIAIAGCPMDLNCIHNAMVISRLVFRDETFGTLGGSRL